MTKDQVNIEYLTNYDFQIYVNKCCQSYHKSPEHIMASPVTVAYCESLQKGGCNEEQKYGNEDPRGTSAAGASSACDS